MLWEVAAVNLMTPFSDLLGGGREKQFVNVFAFSILEQVLVQTVTATTTS